MSSRSHLLRSVVALLAALAGLLALGGFAAGRLSAAPTARPSVIVDVIHPVCPTSITTTDDFTKIANLGMFDVQSADSLVEITFHGRIFATSTNGSGLYYELRVDDAASRIGRIRAILRNSEAGGSGKSVSMGGFFQRLSTGPHTVSMWARVGGGGNNASGVMFDPGCWASDHVLVKEYLPFGVVALPAVLGE